MREQGVSLNQDLWRQLGQCERVRKETDVPRIGARNVFRKAFKYQVEGTRGVVIIVDAMRWSWGICRPGAHSFVSRLRGSCSSPKLQKGGDSSDDAAKKVVL